MKTQAKFTPGPWDYFTSTEGGTLIKDPGEKMRFLIGSNGQGFAHTVGLSAEEDEANAALICAAPDLLAALKATREAMLRHAGWNQNFDASGKELPMTRPKDVQAADDLASAALLKVERTGEGR